MNLFDTLTLPNGSTIPNRLAKAAMEENMADAAQAPSERLMRLYQAWADGGAGLLISGNVMVDSRAMTGPGGVVLENDAQLEKFRRWARIGRSAGAQFWLQINHPGRQMQANLGQQAWAPSAVPLELGGMSRHFATPKAMDEAMIAEVIQRFARSAGLAERAGFSGVEIHAAHGYLLSQFLSPLSNRRSDAWGGSLENRARLLLEIVRAVRAEVAPGFAVAVKLNSADFQRGGFSADDAREVVRMLDGLGIDLVELAFERDALHREVRRDARRDGQDDALFTQERQHAPLGRLQRSRLRLAGGFDWQRGYRYDGLGQLVGIDDNQYPSVRYEYDLGGRLLASRRAGAAASTYRYDA
ncbi:2,4-dienoyl-CoA reductase, partial [Pseudomonas aeruginosa]|nr:2,4-dienoyl-CoA reductase [Pseudomonas aeruginosa]